MAGNHCNLSRCLITVGGGAASLAILYGLTNVPAVHKMLSKLGLVSFDPLVDCLSCSLRKIAQTLRNKHIISVDDINQSQLKCIMELTRQFKNKSSKSKQSYGLLNGKVLVSLFYELSTRTRCSFEAAMIRLGGKAITVTESTSSAGKGEIIEDSLKVLSSYADVIVMRHGEQGVMNRAKNSVSVPLVSGGESSGEHPTQALLDLFTLSCHFPILDRSPTREYVICFVGDLKNGRTTHSLAKLLSRFNVVLRYVAPTSLQMPTEIQREVEQNFAKYNIPDLPFSRQASFSNLLDAIEGCHAIYMTRLQKERMQPQELKAGVKSIVLDQSIMEKLESYTKVLHPLPRVDEIATEIDSDPRCIYFEQAENGLYLRMALLYLLLH